MEKHYNLTKENTRSNPLPLEDTLYHFLPHNYKLLKKIDSIIFNLCHLFKIRNIFNINNKYLKWNVSLDKLENIILDKGSLPPPSSYLKILVVSEL